MCLTYLLFCHERGLRVGRRVIVGLHVGQEPHARKLRRAELALLVVHRQQLLVAHDEPAELYCEVDVREVIVDARSVVLISAGTDARGVGLVRVEHRVVAHRQVDEYPRANLHRERLERVFDRVGEAVLRGSQRAHVRHFDGDRRVRLVQVARERQCKGVPVELVDRRLVAVRVRTGGVPVRLINCSQKGTTRRERKGCVSKKNSKKKGGRLRSGGASKVLLFLFVKRHELRTW